jgi:hypothetical protein
MPQPPQPAPDPAHPALFGVRLDMDQEGELSELFARKLYPSVRQSVLEEFPYYHIDTQMKDGRTMKIHLSPAEDQRRVFCVTVDESKSGVIQPLPTPEALQAAAEKEFGPVSRVARIAKQSGGGLLLVFADPGRRGEVLKGLPDPLIVDEKTFDRFDSQLDLRERAALLGRGFRGVVIAIHDFSGHKANPRINVQTELLDLERAALAFHLGPVTPRPPVPVPGAVATAAVPVVVGAPPVPSVTPDSLRGEPRPSTQDPVAARKVAPPAVPAPGAATASSPAAPAPAPAPAPAAKKAN